MDEVVKENCGANRVLILRCRRFSQTCRLIAWAMSLPGLNWRIGRNVNELVVWKA